MIINNEHSDSGITEAEKALFVGLGIGLFLAWGISLVIRYPVF